MDSRGEAGVRISDVAEAAGTSVGTIYVHFRDRDTLIAAVHAERFDAVSRQVVSGAQQVFDDTLVELFDRARARGLVRDDVSSRSLSLFTQALEMGFVLSDVRDGKPPSAQEWRRLMSLVIGALQPPDDAHGSAS